MKNVIRTSIILVIIFAGFSLDSCNKDNVPEGTPECIESKIQEFKEIACNDGKVDEYTFQGQTVYVFDPGIVCGADLTSEVVLSDCTNLGYLGGISGNVIINGEAFASAEFVQNIWKN